ncbi:hypothetical protein M0802_008622 [Mischocyttarus mexicanus]|nr:hypothetical protein M0802_008622 [Mischocyttarus mexicanus]
MNKVAVGAGRKLSEPSRLIFSRRFSATSIPAILSPQAQQQQQQQQQQQSTLLVLANIAAASFIASDLISF